MAINDFSLYFLSILAELVKDILYFPIWWYGKGLLKLLVVLKNFLLDKQKALGLLIWVKNIFRPMYGQYDLAGILISFLVRLFQIITRSLIMLFWIAITITIFCFWMILPFLVIYEIIFQTVL